FPGIPVLSHILPGEKSLNWPLPDSYGALIREIAKAAATGNWKALLQMGLDPLEQDMWNRALNPISDFEKPDDVGPCEHKNRFGTCYTELTQKDMDALSEAFRPSDQWCNDRKV